MHTFRRSLAGAALASLAASALGIAAFGSISEEVPQLDTAVSGRVAEIGTGATGAVAKESKKLAAARKDLARYAGNDDARDFAALGAAAADIVASRTEDAEVRSELADLAYAVSEAAGDAKSDVDNVLVVVASEAARAKVEKIIATADAQVETALGLVATDPPKALATAVAAWKTYRKAVAKATSAAGGGGAPAGLGIGTGTGTLSIQNYDRRAYVMLDLRFTGDVVDLSMGETVVHHWDGVSITSLAPLAWDSATDRRLEKAGPGGVPPGGVSIPAALGRALNATNLPNAQFRGTIEIEFLGGKTVSSPMSMTLVQ